MGSCDYIFNEFTGVAREGEKERDASTGDTKGATAEPTSAVNKKTRLQVIQKV